MGQKVRSSMPVWPTCENGMLGYVAMWLCGAAQDHLI